VRFIALLALVGCAAPDEQVGEIAQPLTTAVKHERLKLIRDSAAEMGIYNAALIGGIAVSETNLAHCQSEATYACKGPASPSCNGGPIIAGSADGPCADQQGGLGMFQFDAGTYADTLAAYGDSILTVEGNTAQAVSFVIDKAQLDIPDVTDWMTASAWINSVPLKAGDPVTEQWAHLLACRYNGCCSDSSLCNSRAAGYRDNAIDLYSEMGADFWRTADRCASLPDDGVIDQRTACYLAGGDPRYWHREAGGYNDNREFTQTTKARAPANFARWLLRATRATTYTIEAHITGGAAHATYEIVHAGTTDRVDIDQSTADGFVSLGEFALAADGSDEYVQLGDNTGTEGEKLVADALRVTATDGGGSDGGNGGGIFGGCAAGGGRGGGALILLALGLILRRRNQ
jgi:hypothetical protein